MISNNSLKLSGPTGPNGAAGPGSHGFLFAWQSFRWRLPAAQRVVFTDRFWKYFWAESLRWSCIHNSIVTYADSLNVLMLWQIGGLQSLVTLRKVMSEVHRMESFCQFLVLTDSASLSFHRPEWTRPDPDQLNIQAHVIHRFDTEGCRFESQHAHDAD